MKKPTLTVTADFTDEFNETLKQFQHDDVLVGIPEEKTERKDDQQINNATLLAICNFGSTANNIPRWPVMAIGIGRAQVAIAEEFKKAAINALTDGPGALNTCYNRAGIIASTEVKKVLNEQALVPADKPEDSTLLAREARGFKGRKYWIVTGQMRNAITYVVKGQE